MGIGLPKRTILAEVLALQNSSGCYAMNQHFAVLIEASDRQVRTHLTELEEAGHLVITNRTGRKRRMWVSDDIAEGCRRASSQSKKAGVACDPDVEVSKSPALEEPVAAKPASAAPPAEPKPKKDGKLNPTADEHSARQLPNYIPPDTWREFVQMKHREHGPFSEQACAGVINKLTRLHEEGYDCGKLLRGATEACWKTIYERDEYKRSAGVDRRSRPDRVTASGARIVNGRVIL